MNEVDSWLFEMTIEADDLESSMAESLSLDRSMKRYRVLVLAFGHKTGSILHVNQKILDWGKESDRVRKGGGVEMELARNNRNKSLDELNDLLDSFVNQIRQRKKARDKDDQASNRKRERENGKRVCIKSITSEQIERGLGIQEQLKPSLILARSLSLAICERAKVEFYAADIETTKLLGILSIPFFCFVRASGRVEMERIQLAKK